LDAFFAPGEEVGIVGAAEDVIHQLQRPDEELRAMAARAREHTLEEHSGERRARELVQYLELPGRACQRKDIRHCSMEAS
jgi:hypothetical protein